MKFKFDGKWKEIQEEKPPSESNASAKKNGATLG